MAVVHITCDSCSSQDSRTCPEPPYVFKKSWAQLIAEAPADLRRECAQWNVHGKTWEVGGRPTSDRQRAASDEGAPDLTNSDRRRPRKNYWPTRSSHAVVAERAS